MRPIISFACRKLCFLAIVWILSSTIAYAQEADVKFTSSDKKMERAFVWAKGMALHYKGKVGDPVGPWYESALPPREAFCMRDVSHQSIGAEILGLSKENHNMFTLFASNISASKNWCTYWEMNKWAKPAPEDYRNDKEFWYNLTANFDLIDATWRLYLWTGNKYYINDKAFTNFQEKTVKDYIDSWVLDADSLLTRPAHPNAPVPFNEEDSFHRCRGLPSYSEGVPNLKTGVDLVAALYRGLLTYSEILAAKRATKEAALYAQKAERYRQRLEADWWDEKDGRYYTYYGNDHKFGKDEGETFLLWFDALKNKQRREQTMMHIASKTWNVENTSYLPYLFYKNGNWDKARDYILYLADPSTERREYPEVSFGVVEGVIQGLMGVKPNAQSGIVSTIYKTNGSGNATVTHLSLLNTTINLTHNSKRQSTLYNGGEQQLKWKAMFYGIYKTAKANGKSTSVHKETDEQGKTISFIVVVVEPGKAVNVKVGD
ncbi:hypothetical protein SNE25_19175 [Mucilaginibacter sabulilitoris]|uniref:Alpha-L-rhamnosidase six-hairpin glycosidase domain-containing protein n=1 Tax=Mucilaginibacter sabulilitoris TaxID=1173583 RepID=A0ABZ0TGR5_9SPHI|nr:trehalase family glycosidase [Mucilaginibacter sabulilitoris]WPU91443.1 hypothetical protein SNE25_19175 [Mucilaginibacter sabulilitoris]